VQLENSWTMRQIDHVEWLPSGMRTPFEMMNPWRQMMIWAAPFLTSCALWIGFTRRRSVISLLIAIVSNATILAVVGIVARYTSNGTILWLVKGIRDYAFASFIYKNHAGSFFALAVGVSLVLAVYFHIRAARFHRRSSPASLFVFVAMVLLVAVLLSYSRAAILIIGAFLVIILSVGFLRLIVTSGWNRAPLALITFIIGAGIFGLLGVKLLNSEKTLDRINRLTDDERSDYSVVARKIAWTAGYDMASEHPTFGWGAGGFRYLFPRFQTKHSEITWRPQRRGEKQFMFWEHAHNDYLQTLIETGRTGLGLYLLGGLIAIAGFVRNRGLRNLSALTLLGASGVTLVHAAVDFPLQSPAILTSFTITATLALILPTQAPLRSS
jgi:O-antigen ligase